MNPMNEDQHFFDLAMKSIAGQASAAEQAELDSLLSSQPKLKAEFELLKSDVRVAKEVLPLVESAEAPPGKLPEYARGQLQTRVRETLRQGRAPITREPGFLKSQWASPLAALVAVAAVVVGLFLHSFMVAHKPVIQLAMLDTIGDTRGTASNPVMVIQQALNLPKVETFSKSAELKQWLGGWPADVQQSVVKIVYDRNAGEVRVVGHVKGKPLFEKTFPVQQEQDLPAVLKVAQAFVEAQTR